MPTNSRVLFGKRIRELRLKQKWSQEKLAETASLSTAYVSDIERGRRNVGLTIVLKLARAFKVDAGKLFKGVR